MKRFSIVSNGYNIEEVNKFIDIVIGKLEALSNDNNNYLRQLEELKKQSNQNIDVRVSKALIAAQETTDRMKELARAEADLIIKEAKDNASVIVHEALVNAEKAEQNYELLKKNLRVYKSKVEVLTKGQLEFLDSIEID